MRSGQDFNFRQKISALTPEERKLKHQWINNYLANLEYERQCRQAAARNEAEFTGEIADGTDQLGSF